MPWIITVPFLVPRWAAAQTWGPVILVERGQLSTPLLAHELRHYVQARWCFFVFWPFAYLTAWALAGFNYRDNFFERDARAHATNPNYLAWAQRLIAQKGRA